MQTIDMTFKPSQVILSKRHSSPAEQRLIQALRAIRWSKDCALDTVQLLEGIGIKEQHAYAFTRLMKILSDEKPTFFCLGPRSPFITRDELTLIREIRNAMRKDHHPTFFLGGTASPLLIDAIKACGLALLLGDVDLKSRSAHISKYPKSDADTNIPVKASLPYRPVRVSSITAPTPLTRRVTVSGVSLFDLPVIYPAQWIKVFLGGGDSDPIGRAYTVLEFNKERRQVTFDIALHQHGAMSKWASTAGVGDQLLIAGPRGGFQEATQDKDWMLLVADETGLPGVMAIVSTLSKRIAVHAFIEVADEQERRDLPLRDNVSVNWLYRRKTPVLTERLISAIKASKLPPTSGGAWIAGEATVMREVRSYLVNERGFEASSVQATGYWKLGEVDHKDKALVSSKHFS